MCSMDIKEIIKKVSSLQNCTVYQPSGMISLPNGLEVPDDLVEFYKICGGISLFEGAPYAVKIVTPEEFISANPVIIGEEIINAEIEKGTYDNEISKDWFIIADLYNSDYIVIDLNKERLSQCYKAFWDSYPEVGSTTIIAKSFTELLMQLIENRGEYWYFLKDDYISYGDAYDGIDTE